MKSMIGFIRSRPHLFVPAAVLFAVEVASSFTPVYEYFIDELYYIACAKRLAFGYVDHPPLAPLLLRVNGTLFGYSVTALRIIPALAGAAVVILTGLMAAEMGGKRTAQTLAAITALASPLLLTFFSFFSVNSLEILFWVLALYILIRIINTGDRALWLAFGVVAGLALMTKHTFVLLGGATVVALALSNRRGDLTSRQFWIGATVAAALLMPNIAWQLQHGAPSLEFYRNAMAHKNIPTPPLEVLFGQFVAMNPMAFPIWALGVWYLLFDGQGKRYRLIGFVFVILFAALLASQSSRPDRVSGIYPAAIAGGCVVIERVLIGRRRKFGIAIAAVLIAATLALAPLALPLLPPGTTATYAAGTGLFKPIERGEGKASVLPQLLADRIGWEYFAGVMAEAYHALPAEEQKHTSIFVLDYGHAGMLELRRDELGLSEIFSPHNSYWMWGQEQEMGTTVLALVLDPD
ncbi:MAG: glycosyl transferase, family 39, partial [Bacteroidetes bacterium]|nr:glycosyl transferase, family 39 [Bacteroidota bacterium]